MCNNKHEGINSKSLVNNDNINILGNNFYYYIFFIIIHIYNVFKKLHIANIHMSYRTVPYVIREDTHKKSFFFWRRTTKVLPFQHQWLSGPCHFFLFFSLLKAWNGFWQFFFFSPIFGIKQPRCRKKRFFFA